ncbi:MAG: threonine/serine dehydratase [Planctomycetota bacterium]
MITIREVREAAVRIAGLVHRTPVMTSATFDEWCGARIFFKCENLQKVGAFKARGALNAVRSLDSKSAACGVITHSSGNHGAALAWAARQRGIRCVVVMPRTAPAVKIEAVRGYGAEVVLCEIAERDATSARLASERGLSMIHPFENPAVIAGQGTAALELMEDVPALDAVISPVGGGGLLAGTAIAVAGTSASTRVFGAEPAAVDDAARSLATGEHQPRVENPQTICDGLLTRLGQPNFAVLRAHGVEILTAEERQIRAAARDVIERMKLVVEPSGAVGLAVIAAHKGRFAGRRVGVILTGGNTDLRWMLGGTE